MIFNFCRIKQMYEQVDESGVEVRNAGGTITTHDRLPNIDRSYNDLVQLIHTKIFKRDTMENCDAIICKKEHKLYQQYARSTYFFSKLPLKYWVFAISYTTYTCNREGTRCPYEIMYGKKPRTNPSGRSASLTFHRKTCF
jgi:hypothetical protein